MHDPSTAPVASVPRPLVPPIGREADLALLLDLIGGGSRLLTLTGPGGVGKTRLALEAAAYAATAFSGRTRFVPLAGLADGTLVPSAVAQAFGAREANDGRVAEQIAAVLGAERHLLVLDNAEHLVRAVAVLADALLARCPGLVILVTSRQRLAVPGEQEYPVGPLALDVPDVPGSEAAAPAAVRLFVQRARAVKPEFALTELNAGTIHRICARLDGLPLAIELAAARVKVLPPPALLERLERRLPLLSGGGAHLPARQQTMRDTVAWSCDLLTPQEQALFRRLAVFAGGFTLEAAEWVMGDGSWVTGTENGPSPHNPHPSGPARPAGEEDPSAALGTRHSAPGTRPQSPFDLVASLVEQSLVVPMDAADGEPRFGMLETIRDVALERLDASGDAPAARDRHLAWSLAVAEEHGPVSPAGNPALPRDRLASLALLDREEGNLRAALEWSLASGDHDAAARLVIPLGAYLMIRGRPRDRLDLTVRVLALLEAAEPRSRASAKLEVGFGWAAFGVGRSAEAIVATERALAAFRALDDKEGIASALHLLGALALERGDHADAHRRLAAADATCGPDGDPTTRAWILHHLGVLATFERAYDEAAARLEESAAIWRSLGDVFGLPPILLSMAILASERGDRARAASGYRDAMRLWLEVGDEANLAAVFEDVALRFARGADAAALLAAAARLRARTGVPPEEPFVSAFERLCAALQAELGEEGWAAAWSAGQSFSLAEAATLAEAALATPRPRGDTTPLSYGLSPREAEVLKLVAAGLANREIAERLFISLPTVKVHLRAILTKLGVDSRTAAAALAIRQGLG